MNPQTLPSHTLPPLLGRILSQLVDPTVLLSFDRTGYWIHSSEFRAQDTRVDMRGRVCLVTGANSGIGLETARALARLGADVWLLCRSAERGAAAVAALAHELPDATVRLEVVDVSSLESVRQFARRFKPARVDVLVNNAGVLPDTRSDSADGIELTWATNVVGPFLLTHLLLPKLRAATQARVISVSSGGMYATRLNLEDVEWRRGSFDGVNAYALTKRAEVVLNELWAERFADSGITFSAMHPGWADTPAVQSSLPSFHRFMRNRLRTPAEGADTIVWLAVCPSLAGCSGRFWFDRQQRRTHYLPWTREAPEDRQRLWDLCCRQAGVAGSDRET